MKNTPAESLIIQVNGNPVLEYNRAKSLSDAQTQSLKLIEEKLDQGIELGNEYISYPTLEQRIQFVSANLIAAILKKEDAFAAMASAYLAHALPELKQLKAIEQNGEVGIELIFDREYQHEEKLNFTPAEKLTSGSH